MKKLNFCLYAVLLLSSLLSHAVLQATAPENVARAPKGAVIVNDGLSYIVLKKGSEKPATKPYLKHLATGWTSSDGKTQFNAQEDGVDVLEPKSLQPMIPGVAQALKATPVGEKRRWWIAAKLMQPGWGGMVAGNYTVDIEVLAEMDPLPAPENVAKAPAKAITTKTGLQYLILKKGKSDKKPLFTDMVKVHYSGWTTDGTMFDSSILRDQMLEFELSRVIKGWQEGLQRMSVGDKFRLWIPVNMAYGANPRPGAPKGDLVFDVELFEISQPE